MRVSAFWRRVSLFVLPMAVVAMSAVQPTSGQAIPKSQHGSVSQQVAGTKISIEYNRPVARGRKLFGSLVPWNRVWNPGADNGTTISVSTAIRVNNQPLPAGTYSLWAEPRPDRWIIIFNKVHPVFHVNYPAGQDVLRVDAIPREGSHVETLTFYFPLADGKRAELVVHWGTVVVPLQLDVP